MGSEFLSKVGGHHCCEHLEALGSFGFLERFLKLDSPNGNGFGRESLHPFKRSLEETLIPHEVLKIILRVPASGKLEDWSL